MTDQEIRDCPTAWFAVLERAIKDGDYQSAAAAQAELKRLGVEVRWPAASQRKKREGTTNAR